MINVGNVGLPADLLLMGYLKCCSKGIDKNIKK